MEKIAEKNIIDNNILFAYVEEQIRDNERVELRIKGRSMQPTLFEGKDKVVLSPLLARGLQVGDIALFRYNGGYLLHRLISVNNEQLTFQGDNLRVCQEIVAASDVIAIVEYIIKADGKIINCFDSNYIRKVKRQMFRRKLRNNCKGFLVACYNRLFFWLTKV